MSRLLAALLLVCLPAPALAHRLHAEVRQKGEDVLLEVYFSDGTTPAGAQVTVERAGQAVASGTTDAAGAWRFRPPGPGTYRLSVTEPGLHRATLLFTVAGADPDVTPTESHPDPAADPDHAAPPASAPPASHTTVTPAWPRQADGVPWERLGLGLLVIAGLAGALALAQRGMRGSPPERPA